MAENELLHLHYGIEVRALADEQRSVDVVASTSAIDSYGEIVVQDWDLKRFNANPVVLFGHNSYGLPIGFASNVRMEEGRLVATLNFVDAKANPMAEQVWQGIKQGSLRAVSVGFFSKGDPIAADVNGRTVLALSGNELIEISVVPIPANPEAVALAARAFDSLHARAKVAAKKETPTMSTPAPAAHSKSINVALGLAAETEEFAALNAIASLKAFEKDVLTATGKQSMPEALGAIAAAIESAKSATAEVKELKAWREAREREDIIRAGVAAKKLTPAQVAGLAEKPLEFVRGFVEMAHPNPALTSSNDEPTHTKSQLEWGGKKWNELTPKEKHDLYNENRELYEVMRDNAKR